MVLPRPPLLVIYDRSQARRPLTEIAAAAFNAGCRWFSLREKDLPAAERSTLLAELVAMGRPYGATVMAHDDLGATTGDRVRIVETRPLSAKKRWRVVEIVQKAAK